MGINKIEIAADRTDDALRLIDILTDNDYDVAVFKDCEGAWILKFDFSSSTYFTENRLMWVNLNDQYEDDIYVEEPSNGPFNEIEDGPIGNELD